MTEVRGLARAAVLRELLIWHGDLSRGLFGGALRPPTLDLEPGAFHGRYLPAERRLVLSEALVSGQPWGVVIEVLKHEMAHQFVHEVLGVRDETSHGPAFRRVCAERGIDASASGLPDAGDAEAHRVLDRVRKLLALAESPEVNEARAAMRAAQRLLLKHNLEVVGRGAAVDYTFRQVGAVRQRTPKHERLLAGILGKHFFVSAIWAVAVEVSTGARGRVLELCGTASNVEIASYVHDFVLQTAERLWRAHRRAARLTGDGQRRRFVEGLMLGFWDQLEAQGAEQAETGLVWQGDAGLGRWVQRRHRHLRRGRHLSVEGGAATRAGREAGRRLVVHRGVGGPTADRGLRLGQDPG